MNRFLAVVAGVLWLAATASAQPVRLGELNSYKTFPAFLEPYRKGMELAVAEINAAGGVLGRPLELITRDDNGNAGDAVRVAEELLAREKVDVLMGTFSSAVGLAVADFARQRQAFFLAAEPLTDKIVWESGNKYTFRLRPSTYMQTAMLVPDAVRLNRKRWAIVYPNYEYGTAATRRVQAADDRAAGLRHRVHRGRGAAGQDRRRAGGAGAARREAGRDLLVAVRRRSRASSCAKASCAACSAIARCSTCWPASRSISIR